MHVTINVKSPNNISEWQMGFNSAFKGLKSDKNYGYFTWRSVRMFDHMSLSSS